METRRRKQNTPKPKAASGNISNRATKSDQKDKLKPLSKKKIQTELKELPTRSAKPKPAGKKRDSTNHLRRDDLERVIQERTAELRTHQIELEMQNEELRTAHLELEASRIKYADLFEFAPVGYLTFDAKGLIQEANVTMAKQLGIGKKQLLNKPFSAFIHGRESNLAFTAHKKETCLTQQRHTCELKLRHANGALFYAHLESTAVDTIDGEAGHIRTAVTDITERKKVDEALRESEERYRLLVDVSPDAIMIHDGKTCLFANKAAVRLLGATGPDRLVGRDIFSLLHPDFYEIVQDRMAAMKSEVIISPREIKMLRCDGTTIDVESTGSAVVLQGKQVFQIVLRDITDRKQALIIMQARLRMLEASDFGAISMDDVLKAALDVIESQSGSLIGFYHFLEDDRQTLSLQNWSTNTVRNMCTAEGKGCHYPVSQAGVWVDCVRERRPVIHNDYGSLPHRKGLPTGHAPIIREMVVPIWRGGRIVAIIGVGNKPTDYTEIDVEIASLLGDFSWEIVERKRAEMALNKANENLERQVAKRTRDLNNTITSLQSEILDRIQAEQALSESRENLVRLATALESAADAVVITDSARGIIQYVNPAFEKITGYARDEALGRDLHFLDSGRHDQAFYQQLRDTLREEGFWSGRLVQKRKDGTLYEEDCTYSPVKNASGEVMNYISIKRDVTEKVRFESVAQAVDTMNNIGYVFAGVRHEIGNPINSIGMNLEMISKNVDMLPREKIAEYADKAQTQVSKVLYLLRNLKNFNMYESLHSSAIDVSSFLEGFLCMVKEDFGKKGISIETVLEQDAKRVHADPRALQQVLLNVFTNAFDALEGRDDPKIVITVAPAADGLVKIRVIDNGHGMEETRQKDLFKPFYTTKKHGTGLGLVIIKKMVTRMNGTIDVSSRLNEGTAVEICLPLI